MLVAGPPARPPLHHDLHLVRAVRRTFTGPAAYLADSRNRARVSEYLTDMGRPYGREVSLSLFGDPPSAELGQSYGEMAEVLIESAVSADEPVDLLILAFSSHDLRPGRQTATYLSHVTPGAPAAFAICDQGSAAAFTGLRIAREYAASGDVRRVLLIVVEQADLPYDCPAPLPAEHRGVAMLLRTERIHNVALVGDSPMARTTVAAVRQHPGTPADRVADVAAADLAELSTGHDEVRLVLSAALAAAWIAPAAKQVLVMPGDQPSTEVWWGLIDELGDALGTPGVVVVADYDPGLRYLCLTAFDTGS
jgi:hypothetical protein